MTITRTTNTQTAAIYAALDEVKTKTKILRSASTILIDQTIVNLQRERTALKKTTTSDPQELKDRKIKIIDKEIKQLRSLKKEAKRRPIESGTDANEFASKILDQVFLSLEISRTNPKNLTVQSIEIAKLANSISKDYSEISKHIQDIANQHIKWANTEQPELGKRPKNTSKRFSAIVDKLKVLATRCENATQKVLKQATASIDSLLHKETKEIQKAVADREKTVIKNGKAVSVIMQQISQLRTDLRDEQMEISRLKNQLPDLTEVNKIQAEYIAVQSLHSTLLEGSKKKKLASLAERTFVLSARIAEANMALKNAESAKKTLETSEFDDAFKESKEYDDLVDLANGIGAIRKTIKSLENVIDYLEGLKKEVSKENKKLDLAPIENESNHIYDMLELFEDDLRLAQVLADRELGLGQLEAYVALVSSDAFIEPPRLDNDNQTQAWIKQRQGVLDQAEHILSVMNPYIEKTESSAQARTELEKELEQL